MDVIEELGGVLMPIKQKRFNIFSCVPNRTPTLPAQATMVVGPPGWRSMNSDLGAKLHGLASCLILSVYVYRLDECVCVFFWLHTFSKALKVCADQRCYCNGSVVESTWPPTVSLRCRSWRK